MTTMKFQIQLAEVDRPLDGPRIRRGTISAGYSQVIPSHPIAKNVLKTKRKTAATIPGAEPPMDVMAARMTIDPDMPAAPNNMSFQSVSRYYEIIASKAHLTFRRPTFSMMKTAIHEARKYSVPLAAARIRERNGESPIFCS